MTLAKICGLTTRDALDAALDGGAAYVGAVIFPRSPRHIEPAEAAALFARARGRAKVVAVVVDPDDALLEEIARALRPDLIQLHGAETPERAMQVRRLTGAGIVKALSVREAADIAAASVWEPVVDHLMFDARPPKEGMLPGGVGARFDWSLLTGRDFDRPWFLAGGLDPNNVTEAVDVTGAPMVDVSSGVESGPGVKEPALIAAFLEAARRPPAAPLRARKFVAVNAILPNAYAWPDAEGRFGPYGGRFVAETLMPLVHELGAAYAAAKADPSFQAELDGFLTDYVGRPSPLYLAERLTEHFGGADIWFKRDELNHTGAHKVNNCMGQILLAMRMGKTRIIAETGAGQHGVATATVCARFGLPCVIYMGATDVERQQPNVFRMKLLGAEVVPVTSGRATLKDAMNEAMRDWVTNVSDTYYLIGTAAGPHPYPEMVRDFQSVIGREVRTAMLARKEKLPDACVAAIGGGSNAIGLFHPFIEDAGVRLIGVEAAGRGLEGHEHAASLQGGRPGVLHGNRTYLLQDEDGQILEGHSISAGLDYPGIGPEHAWLKDIGRAEYRAATDAEALDAFKLCAALEGIIPALEPSHALARVGEIANEVGKGGDVVLNLCGRGDKDIFAVARHIGVQL